MSSSIINNQDKTFAATLLDTMTKAIEALKAHNEPREVVLVDLVSVKKLADLKGWSEAKIRSKIARKVWIEGEQWIRNPDGDIEISISGVDKWSQMKTNPDIAEFDNTATKSGLSSVGPGRNTAPPSTDRRHPETSRKPLEFMIPLKRK